MLKKILLHLFVVHVVANVTWRPPPEPIEETIKMEPLAPPDSSPQDVAPTEQSEPEQHSETETAQQEEDSTSLVLELTPEEQQKFAKSDIDGLPYRFPLIWAISARCLAKGEDALCPDVLEVMHSTVQEWPIQDTYDSDGAKYEDGTLIPDQNKPVELDENEFRRIFYGQANPKETWLVVFLKPMRSQPQFYHSDYTMNSLKILADYYRGRYRFGYVNTVQSECLKETFGVKTVPQNFMIANGTAYEMGALQVQFKNIKDFLEGDYLKPNKVYQSFSLNYYWPFFTIWPEQLLFLKYAEDFSTKYYLNKIRFNFARSLRLINNPISGEPLYEATPYIDRYFKMRGTPQAMIFWGTVVFLIVLAILLVVKILMMVCACCCGRKDKVAQAGGAKPANKME